MTREQLVKKVMARQREFIEKGRDEYTQRLVSKIRESMLNKGKQDD